MESTEMAYAIISLGGKQYRVQEGQRLLVDRVGHAEGKTFHPDVLFVGGDGKAEFAPKTQVTVKVLGETLGEKIRIGKYKKRTGYRRHTGHRAKLSQIEITSIGAKTAAKPAAKAAAEKSAAEKAPVEKTTPKPKLAPRKPAATATAEKPKAPAKPRTRTAKPKTDEGAE
ncbi:MAG TPA: 50S ribosomal protein L21 [Gaiellaceae bacterium]|nr:50S ribosomal protein L21 [Gaiellaceae bacterium]